MSRPLPLALTQHRRRGSPRAVPSPVSLAEMDTCQALERQGVPRELVLPRRAGARAGRQTDLPKEESMKAKAKESTATAIARLEQQARELRAGHEKNLAELKANHKGRVQDLEESHRADLAEATRLHKAAVEHEQTLGKSLKNVWHSVTGGEA